MIKETIDHRSIGLYDETFLGPLHRAGESPSKSHRESFHFTLRMALLLLINAVKYNHTIKKPNYLKNGDTYYNTLLLNLFF